MLAWLLWFFNHPVLRDLAAAQDALVKAEADNALLQERLDRVESEKAWLREQFERLDTEKTLAYKMVINIDAQREGRPAPFPEAPKLPTTMVRPKQEVLVGSVRSQGSQFVEDATRRFMQRTAELYEVDK